MTAMHVRVLASGGARVGLGHVMRAAVIAAEARRQGMAVKMVLRGDSAAHMALGAELPGVAIEPWTTPFDAIGHADRVVIDAPENIRPELSEARKRGIPAVVLDRLDVLNEAQATVLPVLHAPRVAHPRLYQGAEYVLISPMIRGAAQDYPERRSPAVITLGGADPLALTTRLATALVRVRTAQDREIPIHAVVGPAFADPDSVEQQLGALGVVVHRGLGRAAMAKLMARARFAVSGFGTSLYDLAALGTPVVYWTHRTSDVADACRLEQRGLGVCGGDGTNLSSADAEAVLTQTVFNDAWCLRASITGRALVASSDGARHLLRLLADIGMEAVA